MRAISKQLLIHTVLLRKCKGKDRYGKTEFEQFTLKNVRLQNVVNGIASSSAGIVRSDSLTLFVDAKNSSALSSEGEIVAIELSDEDEIEAEGKSYKVKSVTACYTRGDSAVHHWEASLE